MNASARFAKVSRAIDQTHLLHSLRVLLELLKIVTDL
jgi:hypothetical protein